MKIRLILILYQPTDQGIEFLKTILNLAIVDKSYIQYRGIETMENQGNIQEMSEWQG
jgi:hypothetical protein